MAKYPLMFVEPVMEFYEQDKAGNVAVDGPCDLVEIKLYAVHQDDEEEVGTLQVSSN
jgi:hypothetical protein